tara:strand:+ start:5841 stop:6008 length:168 start_codon:yes stop_codon:yes gene_type:complete
LISVFGEILEGGVELVFVGSNHSATIFASIALSDFHKNSTIKYVQIECHLDTSSD